MSTVFISRLDLAREDRELEEFLAERGFTMGKMMVD